MKHLFLIFILLLGFQLTPLEEAIEMKEYFEASPQEIIVALLDGHRMSATEMTEILLNDKVYPELKERPVELITYLKNYGKYSFTRETIREALDKNFSNLSTTRRQEIMDEVYDTRGTPLAYWKGTYVFQVKWFSGNFSPLIIHHDGIITLEGREVTSYIYDPKTSILIIDRMQLRATNPRAEITFFEENGRKIIRGTVWPDSPSGPLQFGGNNHGFPLSEWQGVYDVYVKWWGSNFTPLIINREGKVTLQGQVLTSYTFNPEDNSFAFSRTEVGEGNPRAEVIFKNENGENIFRGNIWPTNSSGALAFNSNNFTECIYHKQCAMQ